MTCHLETRLRTYCTWHELFPSLISVTVLPIPNAPGTTALIQTGKERRITNG